MKTKLGNLLQRMLVVLNLMAAVFVTLLFGGSLVLGQFHISGVLLVIAGILFLNSFSFHQLRRHEDED